MRFADKFKDFIDISAKLSFGSTIYITDLEKVLYVDSGSFSGTQDIEISKELSLILNYFENDFTNSIIFNDKEVVPIYINQSEDIKYITQIILPIIINDKIFGMLINTNEHNYYEDVNLRYAKTTREFVEVFIKDPIKDIR
jgi:hypothetical protein